ncbi:MAG: HEPN domain-containing protein [Elusimicrobiota bacterium]
MEKLLKDHVNKRLNKAQKKFEVAEILFKKKQYDDAISRAYYAMYHSTMALLSTKNIVPKTHSGLFNEKIKKVLTGKGY